MQKVLITGASGLIGTRLTEMLVAKSCTVHQLSRASATGHRRGVRSFSWQPERGSMDHRAWNGVTAVVHLAGANLAARPWTAARKQELVDSRVQSARMMYEYLRTTDHQVNTFISASAVGYYGDCGSEWLTEEHAPGAGFLSHLCTQWEAAAVQMQQLGIREVRCRLGIVLSAKGGALPEMTKTLPMGVAGYFARPQLYYPWVHLDDVCRFIMYAIENQTLTGPYHVTAPVPLLHRDLMRQIIRASRANAVLLPIPAFALRALAGQLAQVLLMSQRTSAEKIQASGFAFSYGTIEEALKAIYG